MNLTKQIMSSKKQKVLIIDTDQFIIHSLSSKLESETVEVVSADQYGKALELIQKEKFDVIVTEIILPIFSGFLLLENLPKSINKEASILVLSNLQQSNDVKKILSYPIHDYIIKYNNDLESIAQKIRINLEKQLPVLSEKEKEKLAFEIEVLNTSNNQDGEQKSHVLKCAKCEAILPPGTEFCPYCGTKVESKEILQQKY